MIIGGFVGGGRLPRHDSTGLKAECLVALGRKTEARQLLWKDFLETLSDSSYAGTMRLTADEDVEMLKKSAVEAAQKHVSALSALSFLIRQKFPADAAALVVERWQELDGHHYRTIRPAAEKLEIDFPLAAVILRRDWSRLYSIRGYQSVTNLRWMISGRPSGSAEWSGTG